MTRRRTSRLLALPLVFGLLAAACGSDDGDSDGGGDTTPVATEASGGDEPVPKSLPKSLPKTKILRRLALKPKATLIPKLRRQPAQ